MTVYQQDLVVSTKGRGFIPLTDQIAGLVRESGVLTGLCTVFLHHTSASLLINENADPTVQSDLEAFFSRLVIDGDRLFAHTLEGPDDMPAHVRTALTQTSVSLPVRHGRLDLGTWQGIYLWEHRLRPHRRRVSVTVVG